MGTWNGGKPSWTALVLIQTANDQICKTHVDHVKERVASPLSTSQTQTLVEDTGWESADAPNISTTVAEQCTQDGGISDSGGLVIVPMSSSCVDMP